MPKLDPPSVPEGLKFWVEGPADDVGKEPSIREAIYEGPSDATDDDTAESDSDRAARGRVELSDSPEIAAAFDAWLSDWRLWAECRAGRFSSRLARADPAQ